MAKKSSSRNVLHRSGRIFYHIALVALSAAVALSLPFTASFVARKFLIYWSLIGNEKVFLVSIETGVTIVLLLFTSYLGKIWRDRKFSNMARRAGLVFASPQRGWLTRRKIRKLKEKQGISRDVMVIGSTGSRTFVDPLGDLHQVIQNCREAKIMLLNPHGDGAGARARSILDPDITPEKLAEQIRRSIDFLKGLRAIQKNVRLKLYADTPFLKMAILGDYIWIQHYHAGLDVQMMPRYVFKHDQNPGNFYTVFYQYFHERWNSPALPEYDLDEDVLIYRDSSGYELKRGTLDEMNVEELWDADLNHGLVSKNANSEAQGGAFPSLTAIDDSYYPFL